MEYHVELRQIPAPRLSEACRQEAVNDLHGIRVNSAPVTLHRQCAQGKGQIPRPGKSPLLCECPMHAHDDDPEGAYEVIRRVRGLRP